MPKDECEHNVCVIENSFIYGWFTEEELYIEVKELLDDKYGQYKDLNTKSLSSYREYENEIYNEANLVDTLLFGMEQDTNVDEFTYCPDCGKRIYWNTIKKRVNTQLREYVKSLTMLPEEEILKRIEAQKSKENTYEERSIKYKRANNNSGYVYLVKFDKHYKIGISQRPKNRLKEFTKLPYELEIILTEKVNEYEKCEEELHSHFAEKRVRGEWFELDENDVEYIRNYLEKRIAQEEIINEN